jgi:hypothetical protein
VISHYSLAVGRGSGKVDNQFSSNFITFMVWTTHLLAVAFCNGGKEVRYVLRQINVNIYYVM